LAAEGLVHCDAHEPGAKARVTPKRVELRERAHVRLLHDVLGIVVGRDDAPSDPEEPAVVPSREHADGRFVPAARTRHQHIVGLFPANDSVSV
jgi:hypothetical protein